MWVWVGVGVGACHNNYYHDMNEYTNIRTDRQLDTCRIRIDDK